MHSAHWQHFSFVLIISYTSRQLYNTFGIGKHLEYVCSGQQDAVNMRECTKTQQKPDNNTMDQADEALE